MKSVISTAAVIGTILALSPLNPALAKTITKPTDKMVFCVKMPCPGYFGGTGPTFPTFPEQPNYEEIYKRAKPSIPYKVWLKLAISAYENGAMIGEIAGKVYCDLKGPNCGGATK